MKKILEQQKLRAQALKALGRQNVSNRMVEACDDPVCGLCTKTLGASDPGKR
jgi:hypothetical protein